MLDNGYVYPAATRLSAFHAPDNWALVIEVFGYSPRVGEPDICIYTFAQRLRNRNTVEQYVSEEAHRSYLETNPHNELRFFQPLSSALEWTDADESGGVVAATAAQVLLRGQPVAVPERGAYAQQGIELVQEGSVEVYELCRYLAATHRDQVLATSSERRISVLPELKQLLQLEEWHHPDLLAGELPSHLESFQQLALVLATGDPTHYQPTQAPNTHWSHWPEAGLL